MAPIILGATLAVFLLSACAPPPPAAPRRHHYRYQKARQKCRSACVRWHHKRRCHRRCRVRGPLGRCVAWDNVCRRHKVCLRKATRCR